MANLMGVTNPVPNYDGANNNRVASATVKPTDTTVQNIPDATQVGRSDARTEANGAKNTLQPGVHRYDSNLQFYLQVLREAPDVQEEMARAINGLRGQISAPGLSEGIAQEMAGFLQMLHLDADGFREFFLRQMEAGNRFSGPLLSLLRQEYQKMSGENVHRAILLFLKRYSDFSSSEHIANNLSMLLKQLCEHMPKSWAGRLVEMSAQLENGLKAGSREENLKLLQSKIMPYLAAYVERTHDMGTARKLISLLMLNVTRYENGDEKGLLMAFRQLSGYNDFLSGLNKLDDAALLKLLKDNSFTQAVSEDVFARRFAQLSAKALRGEFGSQAKEAFQEILRAILLNESVYMPLRHGIIPMEWENKMVYAEYWVDPDAEKSQGHNSAKGGSGKAQFLFKMDVQDLGFLELAIASQEEQVDLEVYGPAKLAEHQALVAEDLRSILEDHGLKGKNIRVAKAEKPLAITDVFPGLFEGKRSVNVKI